MTMSNPALAASLDLEQLTSELVASISASPRGALNDALQQALARTVEAKVNAQLAVVLEGTGMPSTPSMPIGVSAISTGLRKPISAFPTRRCSTK
ncbi:hypothetical protein AAII07_53610 [Microvirga sp. 0TCS3.31]